MVGRAAKMRRLSFPFPIKLLSSSFAPSATSLLVEVSLCSFNLGGSGKTGLGSWRIASTTTFFLRGERLGGLSTSIKHGKQPFKSLVFNYIILTSDVHSPTQYIPGLILLQVCALNLFKLTHLYNKHHLPSSSDESDVS